jgi:UTP--glucose-1-phosphate uridylyltransferase
MSESGLAAAQEKMSAAGVHQQAIDVFTHYYHQLEEGVTGFIAEDSIDPVTDPDLLSDVTVSDEDAQAALAQTVITASRSWTSSSSRWSPPAPTTGSSCR